MADDKEAKKPAAKKADGARAEEGGCAESRRQERGGAEEGSRGQESAR